MAIKFTDKDDGAKKPDRADTAGKDAAARAAGKARFATPIEAEAPVNPDTGSELPFGKLPRAEKKARGKRESR